MSNSELRSFYIKLIKAFVLFIIISNTSCGQNAVTIDKSTLEAKKKQLSEQETKMLFNFMEGKDTLSIKESKNHIIDYLEYFLKQKEKISSRSFNVRQVSKDEEDYEFRIDTTVLNGVIKELKNQTIFKQTFKNNVTGIEFEVKNGAPNMRNNTDEKYIIKKLYYHDQTVNDTINETTFQVFQFYDTSFKKLKYIDSISVEANFTYIKKYNVTEFNKEELGSEKKGITLVELKDNYVYFKSENPEDFFLIEAYTKEGKMLQQEQNWRGFAPGKETIVYDGKIELFKQAKTNFRKVKTKKEALLILENLSVDIILERREHQHFQYTFKGNVDHIKIHTNKQIGEKTMLFTAVNVTSKSPTFINEVTDRTNFIDINGTTLFSTPKKGLEFINFFYLEDEDDNYYYLDLKQKKLLGLDVASMYPLTNTLVQVSKEELEAVFNEENKNVSGYIYNKIESEIDENNPNVHHLIATILKKGKKVEVILDNKGKEISPEFSGIGSFNDGFANASKSDNRDKEGVIDATGKTIIPFVYDYIRNMNYGNLFVVKKNNVYGIIDSQGKIILPVEYYKINRILNYEGLTYVQKREDYGSYGYINNKGKLVIPTNHYNMGSFRDSVKIIHRKDDKYALINDKGEYIIPYTAEKIIKIEENGTEYYNIGGKTYNDNGELINNNED